MTPSLHQLQRIVHQQVAKRARCERCNKRRVLVNYTVCRGCLKVNQ